MTMLKQRPRRSRIPHQTSALCHPHHKPRQLSPAVIEALLLGLSEPMRGCRVLLSQPGPAIPTSPRIQPCNSMCQQPQGPLQLPQHPLRQLQSQQGACPLCLAVPRQSQPHTCLPLLPALLRSLSMLQGPLFLLRAPSHRRGHLMRGVQILTAACLMQHLGPKKTPARGVAPQHLIPFSIWMSQQEQQPVGCCPNLMVLSSKLPPGQMEPPAGPSRVAHTRESLPGSHPPELGPSSSGYGFGWGGNPYGLAYPPSEPEPATTSGWTVTSTWPNPQPSQAEPAGWSEGHQFLGPQSSHSMAAGSQPAGSHQMELAAMPDDPAVDFRLDQDYPMDAQWQPEDFETFIASNMEASSGGRPDASSALPQENGVGLPTSNGHHWPPEGLTAQELGLPAESLQVGSMPSSSPLCRHTAICNHSDLIVAGLAVADTTNSMHC